jgi:ectoine hydroxylase-related dioxygenase (phytanoyl-CoA dioxygenase family)
LSPWDNKTIIEVEVKEGDLLVCPASVLHKAPKNQSATLRKTIISYNTEATYSDELYKKSFL